MSATVKRSVNVEEELYDWLRDEAERRRRSISFLINEAVAERKARIQGGTDG